jgi:hypothetical protein
MSLSRQGLLRIAEKKGSERMNCSVGPTAPPPPSHTGCALLQPRCCTVAAQWFQTHSLLRRRRPGLPGRDSDQGAHSLRPHADRTGRAIRHEPAAGSALRAEWVAEDQPVAPGRGRRRSGARGEHSRQTTCFRHRKSSRRRLATKPPQQTPGQPHCVSPGGTGGNTMRRAHPPR